MKRHTIIICALVAAVMLAVFTGCKQDDVTEFAVETLAMGIGYEVKGNFVWSEAADGYYQAIMEGKMSLDAAKVAEGYLREITHPLIANRFVRLAGMVGFDLSSAGEVIGVENVDMGLLKVAAQGFKMGLLLDAPNPN